MTKDEALKLALEALEEVKSFKFPTKWDGCFDKEIAAIKEALNGCQCPECQVKTHASDCAVHNEPAYPKGACNCGAQPSVSVEQEADRSMMYAYPSQPKPIPYVEPIGILMKLKGDEHMKLYSSKNQSEPEQEPVAKNEEGRITWLVDNWPQNCLLYAEPPLWTPVEIGVDVTNEGTHVVGMYVLMPDVVRHVFYSKFHPTPQRKPLTDEQINEFFQGMEPNNGFWLSFARAIEAAHGIKGEA